MTSSADAPNPVESPPDAATAADLMAPIVLPDTGSGGRRARRRRPGTTAGSTAPAPPERSSNGTSAASTAAAAPAEVAAPAPATPPAPPARHVGDQPDEDAAAVRPRRGPLGIPSWARPRNTPPPVAAPPLTAPPAAPERASRTPAERRARAPQPDAGRRGTSPQAIALVVGAAVVLVLALIILAVAIVDRVVGASPDTSGRSVPLAEDPAVEPRTRSITIHEVGGEVVGVVVAALDADQRGGTAVFVPPGALVGAPGESGERIDEIALDGGPAGVAKAFESFIGAPVDLVETVDEADWPTLVPARLTIENPAPLERQRPTGTELLFPAGPIDVLPQQLPQLLALRSPGEDDLDRLARQERVWEAWLEAIAAADLPVAGDPATDQPTFMAALARGPVDARVLPVAAVDVTAGLYEVDAAGTPVILAALAPERLAEGEGGRVQLLNGVGEPGLVSDVAALLAPEGLRVPLTDDADEFGYRRTQIVYHGADQEITAEAVREVLGVGNVLSSRQTLDAVDVTVVIGQDLAVRMAVDDDEDVVAAP